MMERKEESKKGISDIKKHNERQGAEEQNKRKPEKREGKEGLEMRCLKL